LYIMCKHYEYKKNKAWYFFPCRIVQILQRV
jgi:hypothetical protein